MGRPSSATANSLGDLGIVALDQGNYEAARDYLEQSAALYQEMNLEVHTSVRAALERIETQE